MRFTNDVEKNQKINEFTSKVGWATICTIGVTIVSTGIAAVVTAIKNKKENADEVIDSLNED